MDTFTNKSLVYYNDVIMTTIASQLTSLAVVYSTVYSDAGQRKHQSSASLAFVWGIHRSRWIPHTKASYAENVSIWWRHHESQGSTLWGVSNWHENGIRFTCWIAYKKNMGIFAWTSYQIRKIAGCACAGNAGNISPPPQVSDPDMHHVMCVTNVPWCIPESLTSGFF